MILLDTDHLSVLKYEEHPRCRALRERMTASEDPVFATTIISAEEQMRGWLAKIHAVKDAQKQVAWYQQLASMIDFFAYAGRTGRHACRGLSRGRTTREIGFDQTN